MIKLTYIILCLIWGSTWLAIKIGLDDAPPLWSAGIRFLIAGLILILINWFRKISYPKSSKEIFRIALPGLIIYAFPYMMVYHAEQYISSALTAVLFASFPFFIAGFSFFMLKTEKPNIYSWLGLVVGFIGIIVVFYDSLIISEFVFLGAVLIVLASAVSAMGTMVIRVYYNDKDATMMLCHQILAGALVTIMAALLFEPISAFKITFRSIGALLYLAIFGSVVAFTGYYWLLKKMKVISLALIAFITPVIAIGLGYLLLSETFSAYTAFGSVLILSGIILVIKK
ncbi:MAG: EamA family transporter [candidate division Zixibacteria bacterium]|nr:EamA family transporter [candidate division Zixibacteria bacterium]